MKRMLRAVAWLLAAVLLLGGAALALLLRWAHGDDARERVQQQASAALGAPLRLRALSVDLWPQPAVAADEVQLQSQPAVALARIELRPAWSALLRGSVQLASIRVRDARVPWPAGQLMRVDGQARLAEDGLPESLEFQVREGRFAGAVGELQRQPDHWLARVRIGGGVIEGPLRLRTAGGTHALSGELATRAVELSALTAPARQLTGNLQGSTRLRAEFREWGALGSTLRTESDFSVDGAVVHGFDLVEAATTLGMSRSGSTRLESLSSHVSTQGRDVQLTRLVATAGPLRASGQVQVADGKALSGRLTVDVAGGRGVVGIPLVVSGTVDAPSVSPSKGALLGAAVGTAVAPGAGTGAGAKLGDRLEQKLKGLFGK